MRGGPLTHELSTRGARWAGEVTTAPSYRLVALDTTPPKPGLIRDPAQGRVIDGEIWTLSPAALGAFLGALPEPMMLGRVELSDGRWVVGFGCAADAGVSEYVVGGASEAVVADPADDQADDQADSQAEDQAAEQAPVDEKA